MNIREKVKSKMNFKIEDELNNLKIFGNAYILFILLTLLDLGNFFFWEGQLL